MKKYKVCNIVLTVCITLVFALLGWLVFARSYIRLWETMKDFASSIRVYCYNIFRLGGETLPTVTNNSTVLGWDTILPENVKELTTNTKIYFDLFFSLNNLKGWAIKSALKLGDFSKAITILLPSILILFFVFRHFFLKENNRYNKDTLPLRIFKGASNIIYQPIKRFALQYVEYVKENSAIYTVWVIIWICHLNLASIIIGFLAYYFYFAGTFDFGSFVKQFGKLIIDFQVIFIYFPYWSLLPVGYWIFDIIRQKRAYEKLRHMEQKNRGFIKGLPIVSMTCGSMGKKKTTVITDMALSQAVIFRGIAYERLKKYDMEFPYFPWICFENELKKCMEYGTVYNLATIKEWMKKKRSRFDKHGDVKLQLYGYDIARYGDTYDDKLKVSSLWNVLETYAQLFYIYVIECSLIVANYSIREDDAIISKGNFPLWQSDFFPKRYPAESRHSHILDFDVLRLGKKLMENNPNSGSFEFGVVVITEVGKERGNNLELKEIKKGTDETNQKNDLFNSWLKMCRHSATVDNYPFVKVFTDEQRPESWGADARDLCDIVRIVSSSDLKLALPFYTIEDMITEWTFNKFINFYYDMRFRRGDNTLTVHLLKTVTSWLFRRNLRFVNTFGYSVSNVEKERGTMDGKPEKNRYYLMNKKIYSSRFSTDCFSDYFNDRAKKSKVGLSDYVEYCSEKATIDELKQQNSYFINSLYKEDE